MFILPPKPPFCGTTFESYEAYEEITEAELDDIAETYRAENAESYEYLETGWDEDWASEEDKENYYSDCYAEWHYITKEEYEEHKDE